MASRLKPHAILAILPPQTRQEIGRASHYGQTPTIEPIDRGVIEGLEGCLAAASRSEQP